MFQRRKPSQWNNKIKKKSNKQKNTTSQVNHPDVGRGRQVEDLKLHIERT